MVWADRVYATMYVRMFPYVCLCECQMDIQCCFGHMKTVVFQYFQVIKKQPLNRMYAMASDNQWSMFSIALYRLLYIYIYLFICIIYNM